MFIKKKHYLNLKEECEKLRFENKKLTTENKELHEKLEIFVSKMIQDTVDKSKWKTFEINNILEYINMIRALYFETNKKLPTHILLSNDLMYIIKSPAFNNFLIYKETQAHIFGMEIICTFGENIIMVGEIADKSIINKIIKIKRR